MIQNPEIKLLQGFCDLPFGTSKENAVIRFGEPEEVQSLHDDVLLTNSMVYHYWAQGFSLFFDLNRNQTFCSVELDNKDTILLDTLIFRLNEKELTELMKKNDFKLSDSEVHNWGEKRLSFDAAGMDCYFLNNKLVSVNFGVLETSSNFQFMPN